MTIQQLPLHFEMRMLELDLVQSAIIRMMTKEQFLNSLLLKVLLFIAQRRKKKSNSNPYLTNHLELNN